jgi:hypothetical protein
MINVLNVDTTTMNASICNGDAYNFGTQVLTEPGEYSEIFTAITGCDSLVNFTLNVTVIDTSVTVNYPTLSANLEDAGYQWVDCNNNFSAINGANEQSFTPIINGSYAVVLEKEFCVDTSSCYDVVVIGIENPIEQQLFHISPNPTTGIVNIQSGEKADLVVIDGIGNEVYHEVLSKGHHSFNLMDQPKGIYFMIFTAETQTKQIKLIKSN